MAMLILSLMAACTNPPTDTAGAVPDSVPTASPWDYEGDDTEVAVDVGTLQRELQSLIDDLRGYNAMPVLDSWTAVRAYGDSMCPAETITESEANGTTTYFERLCIANDRTYFKGPMTTYQFTDNDLLAFDVNDITVHANLDGTPWTGRVMKGQTDVYEVDSDLDYNCSCTAAAAEALDPEGANQWWTYTDGPSHWTGPEDDGTWMANGDQSNMYISFSRGNQDGVWTLSAQGSVSGRGETFGTVDVDIALSGNVDDLAACNMSDRIAMTVRQTATGREFDLTFAFDPSQACYACAVAVEGQSAVCVDFSKINDWEGAPW